MVNTNMGFNFRFGDNSTPLKVSVSFPSNKTHFQLSYGNNALIVDYITSTKQASATWTATDTAALSLRDLLSFTNFPEMETVANALDVELQSFTLDYDGEQSVLLLSVTLHSGKAGFIAAVKSRGQNTNHWNYVIGFQDNDENDTINMANLPVVGDRFGDKISVSNLLLTYVSPGIDHNAIVTIKDMLNSKSDGLAALMSTYAYKGICAGATFGFDGLIPDKSPVLHSGPQINTDTQSNQHGQQLMVASQMTNHDSVGFHKNITINKSLGPIHIQSLGVGYQAGDIIIDISGGISTGPLSINLQELSVSNPLTHINPSFSLSGMGVEMAAGPLLLGGDLQKVTSPAPDIEYQYNGSLNLGFKQFQLDAYGSFAKMQDGDTSLFVYAIADYPLGGPPFCFVTGLAAAFGYNRNLIAPSVSTVSQYPLVIAANNPIGTPGSSSGEEASNLTTELANYLQPQEGEYFAGIGVKFTSLRLIECFALLTAKFGKELVFDLLATGTYTSPAPRDPSPVAVVELEVLGQIIPSEGKVMLQGQLTPSSFLLDKNCHLTGGFAIGMWANGEHEGDFVYSFGGYGKHYHPPAHYPQNVPAIGLHWQINDNMSIRGTLYWAITPKMIAAGGAMHASYHGSFFRAWFDLEAYFQINWKPFHYEAGFHVDFGLSVKVNLLFFSVWLGFNISAGLQLQGPPFGGTASISLSVCTIHLHFGEHAQPPAPLSWQQFQNTFLPTTDKLLSINLTRGLVKKVHSTEQGNDIWVVNPKDLQIDIQTVFPVSTCNLNSVFFDSHNQDYQTLPPHNSATVIQPVNGSFGIKPMELDQSHVCSTLTVTVESEATTSQLQGDLVAKKLPSALWGQPTTPKNNSLINTLCGISLSPAKKPKNHSSFSVSRDTLAWEFVPLRSNAFNNRTLAPFTGETQKSIGDVFQSTTQARENVLKAMDKTSTNAESLKKALDFDFTPHLIAGSFNSPS